MSTRNWTSAQRAALAATGRTLVAAAAGSGKTSVLTERVAAGLLAGSFTPSQLVAVTFTDKAAQEIRDRVAGRLLDAGRLDLVAQLERAVIGTIHGLCTAIMRSHGAALGVDPGAAVFDDAQHRWLVSRSVSGALAAAADDEDAWWLRARIGDDAVSSLVADTAAALVGAAGRRIADPATTTLPDDVTLDDARRTTRAVGMLADAVEHRITDASRTMGRVSFDDLERIALRAVRDDAVRTALRAQWPVVLVDEFQDTNEVQYEILDAIGGDALFMVGDEWQSIYRFRGADVDVFRSRRAEPTVSTVPMRENFRSTSGVLDVVNAVFEHDGVFGERYEHVVVGTDEQRVEEVGTELLVVPHAADGDDRPARERQAARVAERIADLVGSGEASPGDIAVLYATSTGIDLYESAIARWGIPVLRESATGYYERRDVRDALAILACVRNERDDGAALAVLAGPLASLEWHELDDVAAAARSSQIPLLHAARTFEADAARRACGMLDDLRRQALDLSLVELVARVVHLPELALGAAQHVDGAVRTANLLRLVELAGSASDIGVGDVAGYLEFVDAQRRFAKIGDAAVADDEAGGGDGAVRMMTVHKSKGLEFPVVIVVEAGARGAAGRDSTDPLVDPDTGVVHIPVAAGSKLVGTGEHGRIRDGAKQLDAAERRRLWYVAATRAKRRLIVCGHWNFEPTAAGKPRARSGALAWLLPALGCAPGLGDPDTTFTACDGRVRVDTRGPSRTPRDVWQAPSRSVELAQPCVALPEPDDAANVDSVPAPDVHALRGRLRDIVADARRDEWRRRDGTRLHALVGYVLTELRAERELDDVLGDDEVRSAPDRVRERVDAVVRSHVFTRLVALGAQSEVPYVVGSGAQVESAAAAGTVLAARDAVDVGRLDAVATLPDGRWWILDWKRTLPVRDTDARDQHGAQLARYAHVARRVTGLDSCVVTLASIGDPSRVVTWIIDEFGDASAPTDVP